MFEQAPRDTEVEKEKIQIPHEDINALMKKTQVGTELNNQQKEDLRKMFFGPISNKDLEKAQFIIEDLGTGTENIETAVQNWEAYDSERKAKAQEEYIGGVATRTEESSEEIDIEDLLDENAAHLTPEQIDTFESWARKGFDTELEAKRAAWVVQRVSSTGVTIPEALAEWEEKRQTILKRDEDVGVDGGYSISPETGVVQLNKLKATDEEQP